MERGKWGLLRASDIGWEEGAGLWKTALKLGGYVNLIYLSINSWFCSIK